MGAQRWGVGREMGAWRDEKDTNRDRGCKVNKLRDQRDGGWGRERYIF